MPPLHQAHGLRKRTRNGTYGVLRKATTSETRQWEAKQPKGRGKSSPPTRGIRLRVADLEAIVIADGK